MSRGFILSPNLSGMSDSLQMFSDKKNEQIVAAFVVVAFEEVNISISHLESRAG